MTPGTQLAALRKIQPPILGREPVRWGPVYLWGNLPGQLLLPHALELLGLLALAGLLRDPLGFDGRLSSRLSRLLFGTTLGIDAILFDFLKLFELDQ